MAGMKVATFTVHADARQSARWKQSAEGEGFPSVGAWLAGAADAYLKVRAKAGIPIPLAWRHGSFHVELEAGEVARVSGHVSPPFGSFAGTAAGPASYAGRRRFCLVYVPSRRILATVQSFRECKALAAELARHWVRGDGSEPSGDPRPILAYPA